MQTQAKCFLCLSKVKTKIYNIPRTVITKNPRTFSIKIFGTSLLIVSFFVGFLAKDLNPIQCRHLQFLWNNCDFLQPKGS